MRDKITVYGLLGKIYNENTDMPKKICFCGTDYYWNNDDKDYTRKSGFGYGDISFLENHNDNLMDFLQDTVDIIQDNKIEKLEMQREIEHGQEILVVPSEKEVLNKINEIIEVLNEKNR